MVIEIEPNANCSEAEMKVFQEMGPAVVVREICYYRKGPKPQWCAITGWSIEDGGKPCPALAQKIGDSGDGEAILIYGGNGGLRLSFSHNIAPWSLDDPNQWGEPYLVYSNEHDIHYKT